MAGEEPSLEKKHVVIHQMEVVSEHIVNELKRNSMKFGLMTL